MTARIKSWLEKADDLLERNRRYLRPFGFVLFLIIAGLAVQYLFLAIVSVYALATLVGVQNLQLAIGGISALSAVASASVAFFLYRNSVRGANIAVALEDPMDVNAAYSIARTRVPRIPSGTTQELHERLEFEFPLVWTNSGPKGGAITNVELILSSPANSIPTVRDGAASEDMISMRWSMEIAKPEERIPLNSVRLPVFSSGSKNSMSIGDNENVAVTANIRLFLFDKAKETNPPFNSWSGISKTTPNFEFKLRWKTATKGSLRPNERSFKIRPRLGMPLQERAALA